MPITVEALCWAKNCPGTKGNRFLLKKNSWVFILIINDIYSFNTRKTMQPANSSTHV